MVVGLLFIDTRRYKLGLERRLTAVVSRFRWDIVAGEDCTRRRGVGERVLTDAGLTHGWGCEPESQMESAYIAFGTGEKRHSCEDRVEPRPWRESNILR